MSGRIKSMIDTIIEKRSNGSHVLRQTTQMKLLLKGIDSNMYSETSYDDPEVIESVQLAAKELGVNLN